jgi:hypothetical protein
MRKEFFVSKKKKKERKPCVDIPEAVDSAGTIAIRHPRR